MAQITGGGADFPVAKPSPGNGKTEIGIVIVIVVAFISGLDRVLEPWREMIALVRSTSAARVQFGLIEGTLGGKL